MERNRQEGNWLEDEPIDLDFQAKLIDLKETGTNNSESKLNDWGVLSGSDVEGSHRIDPGDSDLRSSHTPDNANNMDIGGFIITVGFVVLVGILLF